MTKTRIEICILSARGLGWPSSLWKPQWFAVGWIDPNNKYCTKVESSGNPNPTWKTKFSVPIDDGSSNLRGLSLTIEVYRREPIFLRENLQGTATIMLKEFFTKFARDEASGSGVEETVSFQLRKRNSGKPHGFVDVSIRVLEEKDGVYSHSDAGFGGDHHYSDSQSDISLAIEDGPVISYPKLPQSQAFNQFGNQTYNQTNYPYPYPYPTPTPPSHPYQSSASTSEGYRRPLTPPPPPPPSNSGFLPTLFPGTTANRLPETYINMPASRPSGPSAGPGVGMGLGAGAGALAAGAMIFGDDLLSGSSFPTGLGDGGSGSFAASTDPLF